MTPRYGPGVTGPEVPAKPSHRACAIRRACNNGGTAGFPWPAVDGYGLWRSLAAHLLWEQGVAGSNPASPTYAEAALSCGRRGCSSMVEPQPSKLVMRVRFPSPALRTDRMESAPVAQRTEQEPSKLLVGGSNPPGGAGFGSHMVAVAQLDRAPGCGPGGRGFETRRPPRRGGADAPSSR